MLRADPSLRRQTFVALAIAAILAVAAVFWFHSWLTAIAAVPGTDLLILRLRRLIGIALTGSAICLALLAWYSAHKGKMPCATYCWGVPLPASSITAVSLYWSYASPCNGPTNASCWRLISPKISYCLPFI